MVGNHWGDEERSRGWTAWSHAAEPGGFSGERIDDAQAVDQPAGPKVLRQQGIATGGERDGTNR